MLPSIDRCRVISADGPPGVAWNRPSAHRRSGMNTLSSPSRAGTLPDSSYEKVESGRTSIVMPWLYEKPNMDGGALAGVR